MKLGRKISWIIIIIVAFLLPLIIRNNNYFLSVFILCVINVLLTSALRNIASVGQICVGTMAFAGIGAYTSGLLMMKFSFPIWAAMPLAGLAALAVAAVIAYPAVRVTGVYFAMVTLFFAEVTRLVISEWRSLTGGSSGLLNIPTVGTLSFFGSTIDFGHLLPYAYFALTITVICLLFLYRIDHSQLGTTLSSIEQDESVATSIGINVTGFKVSSFCIGCFFTGVAGSLYAHYLRVLNPETFGLFPSIYLLINMVAGGRKKFIGPIIGAIILTLIPQIFSSLKEYQPFIYVAALYLVLYLLPGGIVDLPVIVSSYLSKLRRESLAND